MMSNNSDTRAQALERCRKMEATLLRLRSNVRTAACVRARAIGEMLAAVALELSHGDTRVSVLLWWLNRTQYLFDIDIGRVTMAEDVAAAQR